MELNSLADLTAAAVKKLQENHAQIFKCLQVQVVKALDWTKDDVALNDGIFVDDREKPARMKDLESRLLLRRIFMVSRLPLG